jgi:iron complex outermembrane recepter protein
LGESGRLTFDTKWTHLIKWVRTEQDGTSRDFAGTHGNCDVTNCIGTPADRINFSTSWDRGPLSLTGVVNYRAAIKNINFKNDPAGCANTYADGSDAPSGCKIAAFATVDLNVRWKYNDKLELTGNIQNLFDRVAPLDPLTYGQQSFNPLDYSGAVGRYFSLGAKYKF